MLVSTGYIIRKFDTLDEAFDYIYKELGKHNLSYKKIYDHTMNDVRVLVYQYHTLYTEVFMIHDDYEIRSIEQ